MTASASKLKYENSAIRYFKLYLTVIWRSANHNYFYQLCAVKKVHEDESQEKRSENKKETHCNVIVIATNLMRSAIAENNQNAFVWSDGTCKCFLISFLIFKSQWQFLIFQTLNDECIVQGRFVTCFRSSIRLGRNLIIFQMPMKFQ